MPEGEVNFQNFVNEDGSFHPDWVNLVPEELRGEGSLKAIPDFGTMAKNYVNAQKMVGADKIVIPGKNAKPEDWDAVFNKLGRPEKPEAYAIAPPETMPKDFPLDTKLLDEYRGIAHKFRLLPDQVKGIFDWFMETEIKNYNTYGEMEAGEMKQLTEAISPNPYEREKIKKGAEDLFKVFADDNIVKLAEKTKLMENPAFVLVMNQIAGKISEETMKGVKPQGGSPADIQGELNRIILDKDGPYYDKKNPKHDETVAYVTGLYQKLNQ